MQSREKPICMSLSLCLHTDVNRCTRVEMAAACSQSVLQAEDGIVYTMYTEIFNGTKH